MNIKDKFQHYLPGFVLSPSVVLILVFVYGFIFFTGYLSFSTSRMLPAYELVGLSNYVKLFSLSHWHTALFNLAVFGFLYIFICTFLGLFLAIFLDQSIRAEGIIRPIFLYPMAISFIVTGTAWKWFLDPGIGLQSVMHNWGWESFTFTWIKDRNFAIYTVVIAAVWQSSGFIMAIFLSGLRGIDGEIIKAAKIDGASNWSLYRRVIIPQLWPVFMSSFVVLAHLSIKAYDLIVSLTNGGPGRATELPATFMYSYTFTRNQMGIGASSAIIMLLMIASVMVPYIYAEVRRDKHA